MRHGCSIFFIKCISREIFTFDAHFLPRFDDIAYRGKITSIRNVTYN